MTEMLVPEGKFVDIGNGERIHYHEAGEGFPVIFVHGSGQGASGWSNFNGNYPALAAAGLRVLVPDMLGYGYSTMTEEAKFTFDDLVQGIRRFASALGIEACGLVGNSMGGAVCIQLALEDPDFVKKLVLMAPGGMEETEVYMKMKGIRTMIKVQYSGEGITREGMRKIFSLQVHDPELVTDRIIEERYQIAIKQPKGMFEKMRVPNLSSRVGEIQCPILGFWGMNDVFCPPSGAMTIAESCSNTKMTLLTECGHWVMVEHRDYFNEQCAEFFTGG